MSRTDPHDWLSGVIGDAIIAAEGGVSVNSENRPANIAECGVLKTSSLVDGRFDPDENKAILASDRERARIQPRKDHILFSRMNTPALVGQSGFVDKDYKNLFLPDRIWQLTIRKTFDPRWFGYCLRSDHVVRQIIDAATGTSNSMKNISKPSLMAIPISFPPLAEQRKIAAILSSVDGVIEKTRAQIDKLKDLKTGMMQELLTKGIGHSEFKDSPVGRIPSSWNYGLLESVATIQTGIAKNAQTEGDMIEVPYLRVANVQDGYLDLSEIKSIRIDRSRLERFSLKGEDVLVNEGGDFDKLGRGAIWDGQISPCVHQNHVFVVRTDKSCLLPKFFNYLSGSQHGKKYYLGCAKQTTNLASLNSSQLKAFPVLLPPIDEQSAICDFLASVDRRITLSEKKKSAAEALKRALMQDLLTGKVRVKAEKEALSYAE